MKSTKAGELTEASRSGAKRIDTVRNRRKLLTAVGGLLREDPAAVTMAKAAESAELSVPTAYRYFSSVEVLTSAFLESVVQELCRFSEAEESTGSQLFHRVLGEWFRLQDVYGDAIINIRSRLGFLQRLRDEDSVIKTVEQAWRRPIAELLADLKIDDIDVDEALYFYNLIFDPREIRDLRDEVGIDDEALRERLTAVYVATLRTWATSSYVGGLRGEG